MKTAANKPTLTPKLRFPEFRGGAGWEESELRTLADPVTDRAENEDENNILTLSAEQGLVLQSEYFGKKIAGTNAERYFRIQRDDFVYNDRVTKASAYGTIKRLKKHPHGIVSPIYKCFRFRDGELPGFWEWYFEAGAHDAQLRSLANEGARAGRFNVSIDRFLATSVWVPSSDSGEQQKIATCLSSLDDLIGVESRKLDTLKAHKKGLMQELFPREGETVPRLRFPEFRKAGEWVYQPLRHLAKRVTTRNALLNNTRVLTNSAEFGIVDQGNYFEREIVTKSNLGSYYIVEKGDFVYNPRISTFAPVGPISRNNLGTGVMSPLYTVFRFMISSTDYFDQLFETTVWHRYLKEASNIGARHDRMSISTADFMNLPIPIPEHPEQDRIVTCLSRIDDIIAAQTNKHEALKTHKQGLMQQLFPFAEKAGA